MKTIKVTNEMYKFLMDLSKELNTQDHRCTAMPYFFQVQTKRQVPTMEGCGTEAWNCDGSLIETEDEIRDVIIEYKEWNVEKSEKLYQELSEYEIEEILEKIGYSKVQYDIIDEYQNSFFTEKACKAHIKSNIHHYNDPVDYLSYASRNSEMENVMKFLCELTNGKLHK
jgi:hypothetical protein